jgi:hypothetical protein
MQANGERHATAELFPGINPCAKERIQKRAEGLQRPSPIAKFKKCTDLAHTMIANVLCDLPCRRNHENLEK